MINQKLHNSKQSNKIPLHQKIEQNGQHSSTNISVSNTPEKSLKFRRKNSSQLNGQMNSARKSGSRSFKQQKINMSQFYIKSNQMNCNSITGQTNANIINLNKEIQNNNDTKIKITYFGDYNPEANLIKKKLFSNLNNNKIMKGEDQQQQIKVIKVPNQQIKIFSNVKIDSSTNLNSKINNLEIQNSNLKKLSFELEKQKSRVCNNNIILQKKLDTILLQFNTTKNNNLQLQKKWIDINVKMQDCKIKINELQRQNNLLKIEKDNLKIQLKKFGENESNLTKKKIKLQEQSKNLKAEISKLSIEKSQQIKKIIDIQNHYKYQITTLKKCIDQNKSQKQKQLQEIIQGIRKQISIQKSKSKQLELKIDLMKKNEMIKKEQIKKQFEKQNDKIKQKFRKFFGDFQKMKVENHKLKDQIYYKHLQEISFQLSIQI